MLDLEPHKKEINTANDDVLEVVLGLGVLELDMQAILDADIHLDRAIGLGRHAIRVDPEILLADYVGHAPGDGDADEVAQLHVDAVVGLVLLLDILEVEGEGLRVLQFAGGGELLDEGEEFIVASAVVVHLYRGTASVTGRR